MAPARIRAAFLADSRTYPLRVGRWQPLEERLRAIWAAMKTGDARGRPCEGVRGRVWQFLRLSVGRGGAGRAAGTSTLAAAPALLIAVRLFKECAMTTREMRETIESCGLLESNADVLALAAEQER